MRSNVPDYKKYFPHCTVAQVEPPKYSEGVAGDSLLPDPLTVASPLESCDEPKAGVVGPRPPRPLNHLVDQQTGVDSRGLTCLCILGWLAAVIEFSLWLLH